MRVAGEAAEEGPDLGLGVVNKDGISPKETIPPVRGKETKDRKNQTTEITFIEGKSAMVTPPSVCPLLSLAPWPPRRTTLPSHPPKPSPQSPLPTAVPPPQFLTLSFPTPTISASPRTAAHTSPCLTSTTTNLADVRSTGIITYHVTFRLPATPPVPTLSPYTSSLLPPTPPSPSLPQVPCQPSIPVLSNVRALSSLIFYFEALSLLVAPGDKTNRLLR